MTSRRPKAELTIVQSPDIQELERVLTETMSNTLPAISRTSSSRLRFETEVQALEAERETVEGRKALAKAHYESLVAAFDADIADINGAIALRTAGLTQAKLQD